MHRCRGLWVICSVSGSILGVVKMLTGMEALPAADMLTAVAIGIERFSRYGR